MPSTLLYGQQDTSADAAKFIAVLLDAVIRIHKAHFMTTGAGSFAAHEALGESYEALHEDADRLADAFMGCMKTGLEFPDVTAGNWPGEVRKIYDYIGANRYALGNESHIQNLVDETLDHLAKSLFKLERLA